MHSWLESMIETLEDEIVTVGFVRSEDARVAEDVLRRCVDALRTLDGTQGASPAGGLPEVSPVVAALDEAAVFATSQDPECDMEVAPVYDADFEDEDEDVSLVLSATVTSSVPFSPALISRVTEEISGTLDLFGGHDQPYAVFENVDQCSLSLAWVVTDPTELVGATMFEGGWTARFDLGDGVFISVCVRADGSALPDLPTAQEAIGLWCDARDEEAEAAEVVRTAPSSMRMAFSRQDGLPIEGGVLDAARAMALSSLMHVCGQVRYALDGAHVAPGEWVETVEFDESSSRAHRLAIAEGAGAFDGVRRCDGVMVRARIVP